MDNGVIIAKTLKPIAKGEQLYVSYNSNVMYCSRSEKQRFLQQLGTVTCHCEFCTTNVPDPIVSKPTFFY